MFIIVVYTSNTTVFPSLNMNYETNIDLFRMFKDILPEDYNSDVMVHQKIFRRFIFHLKID